MDTPQNPSPESHPPTLTDRLKSLLLGGTVALLATHGASAAVVTPERDAVESRIEQVRQSVRAINDQAPIVQPGQGVNEGIQPTWWRNAWGNGGWHNWHNGWHNGGWHNWGNGWHNGGWHNWLNF